MKQVRRVTRWHRGSEGRVALMVEAWADPARIINKDCGFTNWGDPDLATRRVGKSL
jgi:hypothetical protein